MGRASLADQLQSGVGSVDGNAAVLEQLASVLVSFNAGFEVLPGTLPSNGLLLVLTDKDIPVLRNEKLAAVARQSHPVRHRAFRAFRPRSQRDLHDAGGQRASAQGLYP